MEESWFGLTAGEGFWYEYSSTTYHAYIGIFEKRKEWLMFKIYVHDITRDITPNTTAYS